jgi:hypothetical protein
VLERIVDEPAVVKSVRQSSSSILVDNYLVPMSAGFHRLKAWGGIHTGALNWSAFWLAFRKMNPNATKDEMLQFGRNLIRRFGLTGFPGTNIGMFPVLMIDLCKYTPYSPSCIGRGAPTAGMM